MRISSIYIDGFGVFCDQSISGLGDGLILFQGNNEAGKSTLLSFIRTILFGFPRANARDPQYPPLAGGIHGGRIGLAMNTLEEYIVERKPGKGGGVVTIRDPDGNAGTHDLLSNLLGSVTFEVFRNIYAFSLAELQTIETLRQGSVKSVIYGASAGTAMLALPKANKKIKERLDKLFKPGGKKPVINQKMAELEKIRSELREASKGISQFDQACKNLEEVEKNIHGLQHDLVQISRDRERFSSYARLWPEYLILQETERAVRELPKVVESFPENGVARLDKELDTLKRHQERLSELQDELRQLHHEAEKLEVDEILLTEANTICFLLEKKSDYAEKCKSRPC